MKQLNIMNAKINLRYYVIFINQRNVDAADIKC